MTNKTEQSEIHQHQFYQKNSKLSQSKIQWNVVSYNFRCQTALEGARKEKMRYPSRTDTSSCQCIRIVIPQVNAKRAK